MYECDDMEAAVPSYLAEGLWLLGRAEGRRRRHAVKICPLEIQRLIIGKELTHRGDMSCLRTNCVNDPSHPTHERE